MNILDLPIELLSTILELSMKTGFPVYPTDLARVSQFFRTLRANKSRSSECSDYLHEWYPSAEIAHLGHWFMVNGTCHRFRALGKVAFLSQKQFLLNPLEVEWLFCSKNQRWRLSHADTLLARQHIRHVIMYFGTEDAYSGGLGCCSWFGHLHTIEFLYINMCDYGHIARLYDKFELVTRIPINGDLRAQLSNIGLNAATMTICFAQKDWMLRFFPPSQGLEECVTVGRRTNLLENSFYTRVQDLLKVAAQRNIDKGGGIVFTC